MVRRPVGIDTSEPASPTGRTRERLFRQADGGSPHRRHETSTPTQVGSPARSSALLFAAFVSYTDDHIVA